MSSRTLHFFTTDGKETAEGSVDSVVQYDEATATKLGLKFKASDEKEAEPESLADRKKAASLDGSEADAPPVKPARSGRAKE